LGWKGIRPVEKLGAGFVGGDDMTGALHVLQLQLLSPPPSPLAPIKSIIEILVHADPGPPGKW